MVTHHCQKPLSKDEKLIWGEKEQKLYQSQFTSLTKSPILSCDKKKKQHVFSHL
jgi:hypothetical protein